MSRVFFDKDGNPHQLPVGRENGRRYNKPRYEDPENPCPECGFIIYYTKNGVCWKCAQSRACDLYSYVRGLMTFEQGVDGWFTSYKATGMYKPVGNRLVPDTYQPELDEVSLIFDLSAPTSRREAMEKGLKLWVTGDPCPKAGHYGIKTLENECYFCEEERKKPKPRQEAIKAGKTWYKPDAPCKHCNTLSERNVHTGACKGCRPVKEKSTPESLMMKDHPDLIIQKDAAKRLGLKVYRTGDKCKYGHTGFRYVSTNGCIDCKKGLPPKETT